MNPTAQKHLEHLVAKHGHVIGLNDVDAVAAVCRLADEWLDPVASAGGEALHWLPLEVDGILFYRPSIAAIAYVQSVEADLANDLLADCLLALIMTRREQLEFIREKLQTSRCARFRAHRFARTCGLSPDQLRAAIASLMSGSAALEEPGEPAAQSDPASGLCPPTPCILPSPLVAALCSASTMSPDQLFDQEPAYISALVANLSAQNPEAAKAETDARRDRYFQALEKLIESWKSDG